MKTYAILLENEMIFKDQQLNVVEGKYRDQMGSFAYLRLDSRMALRNQIQLAIEFMNQSRLDKPVGVRIAQGGRLDTLSTTYKYIAWQIEV